ncbi:Cyanovirin-N [Naviculisporaceae sp. PSN 640]
MQLASALQSLVALAVMIPTVIATPVALDNSVTVAVEERGIEKRSYTPNHILNCFCEKPGVGLVHTSLDLNKCIVNDHGIPRWRVNGGFSGTCGTAGFNGRLYQLNCKKPNGDFVWTPFDLNERIHNINGNLQCHI